MNEIRQINFNKIEQRAVILALFDTMSRVINKWNDKNVILNEQEVVEFEMLKNVLMQVGKNLSP